MEQHRAKKSRVFQWSPVFGIKMIVAEKTDLFCTKKTSKCFADQENIWQLDDACFVLQHCWLKKSIRGPTLFGNGVCLTCLNRQGNSIFLFWTGITISEEEAGPGMNAILASIQAVSPQCLFLFYGWKCQWLTGLRQCWKKIRRSLPIWHPTWSSNVQAAKRTTRVPLPRECWWLPRHSFSLPIKTNYFFLEALQAFPKFWTFSEIGFFILPHLHAGISLSQSVVFRVARCGVWPLLQWLPINASLSIFQTKKRNKMERKRGHLLLVSEVGAVGHSSLGVVQDFRKKEKCFGQVWERHFLTPRRYVLNRLRGFCDYMCRALRGWIWRLFCLV